MAAWHAELKVIHRTLCRIDDGNLEAKAVTTDLATVHGQKRIAFQSDSTTASVGTILQQIELASELGELACCFMQ